MLLSTCLAGVATSLFVLLLLQQCYRCFFKQKCALSLSLSLFLSCCYLAGNLLL